MAVGLSAGVAFIDILPNMAKFSAGLTSGVRRAGAAITSTGRTLTHGLSVPIALVAGASLKMSLDFQKAMVQVRTQAGASQGEVDRMSKAVLNMASSVGTGPNELAAGLYHVESVGFRSAKALNVLKTAALGAKVGANDLEDTASALSAVLFTNIKGTGNMSKAMGTLNGIIGSGNMRMGDLVNALKSGIIPTAKIAGLDLKGIGAALAMMTDEGVPATVAANRLRTMLFMLTNPTDKAKAALKSLGMSSLDLGHDMQKPDGLSVAMKDLQAHMEKIHDPTKRLALLGQMFGGSRSAGTVAMLLNNLGRIKTKYDQIQHVANTYQKSILATKHTEQFKIDQAWAAIQADLIKTGAILMPLAVQLADAITRWMSAFQGLNPEYQKFIVYGALAVAALGPLLLVVGNVMTVIGVLGTALTFVGTAMVKLATFFIPEMTATMTESEGLIIAFGGAFDIALGPIGLLALGIAGVGLAALGIIAFLGGGKNATTQLDTAATLATSAVNGLNAALDHQKTAAQDYKQAIHQQKAAALGVEEAQKRVNQLIKEGKKGTLPYREALNQLSMARDTYTNATTTAEIAERKATATRRASIKAIHADKVATKNLIKTYWQKVKANNASIKASHYDRFQSTGNSKFYKANAEDLRKLATSLGTLAKAHEHNAAVQEGKGNKALADTERHLALVDDATRKLINRLGHMPTHKQISIQVALEAEIAYIRQNPLAPAPPELRHGRGVAGRGRAGGGSVTAGTPYVVGEVGPELFVPSVSGHIIPNRDMAAGGAGGSTELTITNWHEGTGYISSVADGSVSTAARNTRKFRRMHR